MVMASFPLPPQSPYFYLSHISYYGLVLFLTNVLFILISISELLIFISSNDTPFPVAMARGKGRKKGKTSGKFRKSSGVGLILSDEDLKLLVERTSFDADEISEWFR